MDFGIAPVCAGKHGRTVADKAIGSVHYISPEQARGEQTDERTDIYSVGVIMYELLTGQVPFDGDTPVSIAIKQMQQEPVLPTSINPSVPVGLEEITLRAMQKEPELRYQSASEMLKDIDEFKQNPDVVFEYKYFNEDGTTKYFDRPNVHAKEEATSKEKQKKKGAYTLNILAGVAAACVILAGVALFFFFKSLGQRTPDVLLPDLTGKTVEEAQAEVPDVKIVISSKEPSADFTVNQIISQDPGENMTVKAGSEVKVVVSTGMETVQMPDLTNKPIAEAREALSGYEIDEIRRTDSTIAAGNVISTNPKAGDDLNAGDTVTIYVSLGSADLPATVPNLEGLTEVTARNKLTVAGLSLGEVKEVESDKEKGTVVGQSIAYGKRVTKGTKVDIEISSGKSASVEIPVSLKFPSGVSNTEYSFVIYVNGTILETRKINPATTSGLSMKFISEGGKINGKITEQDTNEVTITVNSKKFASYTLNFKTQSYSTAYGPDYSLIKESASSSKPEESSESSEKSDDD